MTSWCFDKYVCLCVCVCLYRKIFVPPASMFRCGERKKNHIHRPYLSVRIPVRFSCRVVAVMNGSFSLRSGLSALDEKEIRLTPYDRDVNSRLAFGSKMLTELRATSTG